MTVYAYLRVSTDEQDIKSQKHGILEYANQQDLGKVIYQEDTVSGKTNWKDRKLGELINETMLKGDTLVIAEISRMARSTLQVLEILQVAAEREVNVHIAKQKMVMDDSMQSKITATVLGLAAEIEREFVSIRTKEGLAKRKKEIEDKGYFINARGEKVTSLGRPKGRASTTKLDKRENEIKGYLKKKISKRSIAKLVDCAPSTLYDWLNRKKLI